MNMRLKMMLAAAIVFSTFIVVSTEETLCKRLEDRANMKDYSNIVYSLPKDDVEFVEFAIGSIDDEVDIEDLKDICAASPSWLRQARTETEQSAGKLITGLKELTRLIKKDYTIGHLEKAVIRMITSFESLYKRSPKFNHKEVLLRRLQNALDSAPRTFNQPKQFNESAEVVKQVNTMKELAKKMSKIIDAVLRPPILKVPELEGHMEYLKSELESHEGLDGFPNKEYTIFLNASTRLISYLMFHRTINATHKCLATDLLARMDDFYSSLNRHMNQQLNNPDHVGSFRQIMEPTIKSIAVYINRRLALQQLYKAQQLKNQIAVWLQQVAHNQTAIIPHLVKFDQLVDEVQKAKKIEFDLYTRMGTWNVELAALTGNITEKNGKLKTYLEMRTNIELFRHAHAEYAWSEKSIPHEVSDFLKQLYSIAAKYDSDKKQLKEIGKTFENKSASILTNRDVFLAAGNQLANKIDIITWIPKGNELSDVKERFNHIIYFAKNWERIVAEHSKEAELDVANTTTPSCAIECKTTTKWKESSNFKRL